MLTQKIVATEQLRGGVLPDTHIRPGILPLSVTWCHLMSAVLMSELSSGCAIEIEISRICNMGNDMWNAAVNATKSGDMYSFYGMQIIGTAPATNCLSISEHFGPG